MSRRFSPPSRPARPIDATRLDELALAYVARYATSRAKLTRYLQRKLAERGYDGEGAPPVEAIVARLAALNYVDDAGYAAARGKALTRRGFGERRLAQALTADGIGADDAEPVRTAAREDALPAAIAFARRRRLGPFAAGPSDPDQRRRAIAAMLRAGHSLALARRVVTATSEASLDDE